MRRLRLPRRRKEQFPEWPENFLRCSEEESDAMKAWDQAWRDVFGDGPLDPEVLKDPIIRGNLPE